MKQELSKKLTGTSLFALLLVAGVLTSIGFARAAYNSSHGDNGNGNKYGHTYGVGNGGTPPNSQNNAAKAK